MNSKQLENKYGVSVTKFNGWWHAYMGGNGTGIPVVTIAEACTLKTLALRIERALKKQADKNEGKPLIEILD